jgi:hypothetical protein
MMVKQGKSEDEETKKNLLQCHFIHQESKTPGIEPDAPC